MSLLLAHLSSDVLGLILNSKDCSYLTVDLWKTGDTILRAKLASVVTYLHLKDVLADSTSRFPKLVSSLRNLRYFSINRGRYPLMASSRDLSVELQKLSSLHTLKIQSKEANACLLNHAPNWTSDGERYTVTRYGAFSSNLLDMASLFPNLSTLKLVGKGDDFTSLAGLPPTLTTLILPRLTPSASALASLPRSLTSFKGEMFDDSETSDWLHAPPSLTHVSTLRATAFTEIPPTLHRINLQLNHWSDNQLIFHDDLKTLSVDFLDVQDDPNWTSRLPKNLEEFRATVGPIPPASIASLPRSLTHLYGNFRSGASTTAASNSEDDKSLVSWPPLLRELYASQPVNGAFLASLSTLSFLRVLEIDYRGAALDGSILPRSLVSLSINPTKALLILPGMPSLEVLTVDSSCHGAIHEESFPHLPTSLRDLSLTDPTPGRAYARPYSKPVQLPPYLKSLMICSWNMEWELPRSLTTLELLCLSNLKERLDLPPVDPFESFPPSLTHLTIGEVDQSEILSKLAFSSLPRLSHLSCPAKLHSSVLRGLSRRLSSIFLRMGVFDEADAPFLPPRLTLCSIGLSSGTLPSNIGEYWPLSVRLWTKESEAQGRYMQRQEEASIRCTAYPDPRVVERTTKALLSNNVPTESN